jgi:hypothetical protein
MWQDNSRGLSKAQYDFWKRSFASNDEKRELIAAWKFINVDVRYWLYYAYYPGYLYGIH